MKNPQNGDWYLLAYKHDTFFITITRSPRGIARAWHGYSDTCLSVAAGYGYDKESSVLADACAELANMPIWRGAMAVGIETLKRMVRESGGRLYDRSDALDLIHQDIKLNNY